MPTWPWIVDRPTIAFSIRSLLGLMVNQSHLRWTMMWSTERLLVRKYFHGAEIDVGLAKIIAIRDANNLNKSRRLTTNSDFIFAQLLQRRSTTYRTSNPKSSPSRPISVPKFLMRMVIIVESF
jgi:hypothetical protein